MKNEKKKIVMAKRSVIAEHKRLVPELKKAGLKKEAERQEKELKEYEHDED